MLCASILYICFPLFLCLSMCLCVWMNNVSSLLHNCIITNENLLIDFSIYLISIHLLCKKRTWALWTKKWKRQTNSGRGIKIRMKSDQEFFVGLYECVRAHVCVYRESTIIMSKYTVWANDSSIWQLARRKWIKWMRAKK